MVTVTRALLLGRHDRFGLAQFHDHIAFGMTLYTRGHDLAFAVHELAVHLIALNLFDALEHNLLRRLRCNTTKVAWCGLDKNGFAKLHIASDFASIGNID